MRTILVILTVGAAVAGTPAAAQADMMTLAQAVDRCMATYAVRLTRTTATDDQIFDEATAGCKALNDQLDAAIARELPAQQAADIKAASAAQARPNFMQLLQRIRADRASRPGN